MRNRRPTLAAGSVRPHQDLVTEFIGRYTFETQVPGICVRPGCDYMAEVEADTRHGRCQQCGLGN